MPQSIPLPLSFRPEQNNALCASFREVEEPAFPSGWKDVRASLPFWRNANERPAVLLGSEKRGLSEHLFEASAFTVRIPMRGRWDSINVAVAAGVLLV